MKVNTDKNLDKDVFNTIKTAIDYPPKAAWNKITYINFCKLAQIKKTLIISGQIVPPFNIKLSSISATYLLILYRL